MIGRVRRALQSHGPVDLARIVRDRAVRTMITHESHIWYELDVAGDRPRRELPPGLELRRASVDSDLEAVAELPGAGAVELLQAGLAAGHELWMVADGERAAFCCWLQYGTVPLRAGRNGTLELPTGTVCLEDSITSADYRGQGIAPGAWCLLADSLAAAGQETMITKVETENQPSRRAVEKAGFREIGTMDLRRRGLTSRVAVAFAEEGIGPELSNRILG